jgi:hypothetical protein
LNVEQVGAQQRLEEFYAYKTNEKNIIIGHQLDLETVYNNLSMRLAHNLRPKFEPGDGLSLKDFNTVVHHLEECEQERKVALHAELNRQIRLVGLDGQHTTLTQTLRDWIHEKVLDTISVTGHSSFNEHGELISCGCLSYTQDTYLRDRPEINSVGAAQFQLKLLDAFDLEAEELKQTGFVRLSALGQELLSNTYERSAEVSARTQEVESHFGSLLDLSSVRRPELGADLAREIEKERLRLEWAKLASAFNRWTHNKTDTLAGYTAPTFQPFQVVLGPDTVDILSGCTLASRCRRWRPSRACSTVWCRKSRARSTNFRVRPPTYGIRATLSVCARTPIHL